MCSGLLRYKVDFLSLEDNGGRGDDDSDLDIDTGDLDDF
jgi:hypothetical protein